MKINHCYAELMKTQNLF